MEVVNAYYLYLCIIITLFSGRFLAREKAELRKRKRPVLEKYVKSKSIKLPKVGQNELQTITDAKQETEPILTKAQKKKLQIEYQKQFIQRQRTKEGINASQEKKVNPPLAIYPQEFAKTNKLRRNPGTQSSQ
ncbi:Hypothetical_protein [Hexamita inflata]|uniref:Hypothetical_protein n=1 Tax=Hexamita inflata TaxID=28002 RepID=A0AA86QZK9_9EUKA|nr:Hypothetical protein HINF_LOCUS50304 [Hexamita inflata]